MFGIANISAANPIAAAISVQGGNVQASLSDSQSLKYSASMDGTDDKMTMFSSTANVTNALMGAGNSWTFAFQVRFPSSANSKTIMFQGSSTNYVWMQTSSGGDLVWTVNDSGTIRFSETWDTNFAADTWYHVVIVMDGSGSNYDAKCYVNGTEVSSIVQGTYPTSSSLTFGGSKLSFGVLLNVIFYAILLDEISAWGVALDANNASALANLGQAPTDDKGNYTQSSNLWGLYRFEEGQGTTASDSSGNGRMDITLVNATFAENVRLI